MNFKSRIISVVHSFLLSKGGTGFLQNLQCHPIPGNIGCEHIDDESVSTHVQSDSDLGYMAADIRNGNPHRDLSSIPCEAEHGGILHCPRVPRNAFWHGSFSFVKTSKRTKRNLDRTCLPHAGKQIYHHVIEQHRNIQHLSWLDDAAISAPSLPAVPTYDTVTHTVGNEPHPKTRYQHHPSSAAVGLFFEHSLNFRVGTSNHRTRLSQSKSKLTEKSLALSNSQCYPKIFSDKGRQ